MIISNRASLTKHRFSNKPAVRLGRSAVRAVSFKNREYDQVEVRSASSCLYLIDRCCMNNRAPLFRALYQKYLSPNSDWYFYRSSPRQTGRQGGTTESIGFDGSPETSNVNLIVRSAIIPSITKDGWNSDRRHHPPLRSSLLGPVAIH